MKAVVSLYASSRLQESFKQASRGLAVITAQEMHSTLCMFKRGSMYFMKEASLGWVELMFGDVG